MHDLRRQRPGVQARPDGVEPATSRSPPSQPNAGARRTTTSMTAAPTWTRRQANVQSLSGHVRTPSRSRTPDVAAPTLDAASDFDFEVRTNDFAAVNAYYHQTRAVPNDRDLGFVVGDYFDGTTFPIPVDHRASWGVDGNTINAHWSPNGGRHRSSCVLPVRPDQHRQPARPRRGPVCPLARNGRPRHAGRSRRRRHARLLPTAQATVWRPSRMDPESALARAARTLPLCAVPPPFSARERRFDRPVAAWAWGSEWSRTHDELTANGDRRRLRQRADPRHLPLPDLPLDRRRRRRPRPPAVRVAHGHVPDPAHHGNLTAATNPNDPEVWCEEMQDTDLENWTTEGLSGGAYNKVIRWAFEKQGSYQPQGADAGHHSGRTARGRRLHRRRPGRRVPLHPRPLAQPVDVEPQRGRRSARPPERHRQPDQLHVLQGQEPRDDDGEQRDRARLPLAAGRRADLADRLRRDEPCRRPARSPASRATTRAKRPSARSSGSPTSTPTATTAC